MVQTGSLFKFLTLRDMEEKAKCGGAKRKTKKRY
jgi:hypothetical protein